MPDITIRPVEANDETSIARLWQGLTNHVVAMDNRLPPAVPGAAQHYAARLLETHEDANTRTLVADDGTQIVGYILGAVLELQPDLFEYTDSGFIADVFVDPDFRRQGVGRRLVEAMFAWFKDRGVTQVEWQVTANDPDAVAFWEAVRGTPLTIRMQVNLEEAD